MTRSAGCAWSMLRKKSPRSRCPVSTGKGGHRVVTCSSPLRRGAARSVTAQDLETGEGLDGALGDGAGKWQLVVSADTAVVVMSLLESPSGHLTNLSTAGSRRKVETAEEVFEHAISASIVQEKCVNCHVEGGVSGNTRLVFVPDSEDDHVTRNLEVFRDFIATVDGAASLILNKIQGVGHGGGIQVAAGSEEFEDMRRFLDLLAEGDELTGPVLTADKLFDSVRMESSRRTLSRAALVFAGRLPTAAELAPFPGGTTKQLRDVIRGMMEGPDFHAFLTRGANDRLLTESLRHMHILADGHIGVYGNGDRARFLGYEAERERHGAVDGSYPDEYYQWEGLVRYGAVQAPVELIAHVVENDLPYTEILTADYTMANGATAKAYSDPVEFDDPDDPFEFRPARFPRLPAPRKGHGGLSPRGDPQHDEFPRALPDDTHQPQPRPVTLDVPTLPGLRHPERGADRHRRRRVARHPQPDHAQPGLHGLPHSSRPRSRGVPELHRDRILSRDL